MPRCFAPLLHSLVFHAQEDHVMELDVRQDWAGFDLLRVGGEKLVLCREENLVVLSGCITTTSRTQGSSTLAKGGRWSTLIGL